MTKLSQNKKVLNMLRTHNSITPEDVYGAFKCMRLGARIFDLKEQGHSIINLNKSGYARYALEENVKTDS